MDGEILTLLGRLLAKWQFLKVNCVRGCDWRKSVDLGFNLDASTQVKNELSKLAASRSIFKLPK
jgi:hypothetical protein